MIQVLRYSARLDKSKGIGDTGAEKTDHREESGNKRGERGDQRE